MASIEFPIDEAQIIALFMGSVLYGTLLISFVACIRVLWLEGRTRGKVNKPILIVATAMAVIATLSIAFQLRHVLDAFVWYRGPGGPIEEFEDISYWVNAMQTITYFFQTLIGDIILIYRCFIVYDRRWLVISFPFVMWLGSIACGAMAIRWTFDLRFNANMDQKVLTPLLISVLVLTMVQSIFTTTLIAFRIWSIDREVAKYRLKPPMPVLKMIIESGAIYALSTAIFLIVYLCKNNAQYPFSVAIEQIIGIVFNMLIIRVHRSYTTSGPTATGDRGTSFALSGRPTPPNEEPLSPSAKAQWHTSQAYAMKPVQVTVTHQVVDDADNTSAWENKGAAIAVPSLAKGDV